MKKKGKKTSRKSKAVEQDDELEEATEESEESGDEEPSATGGKRKRVDYKLFVKTWMRAATVGEVADTMGIKTTSATAIASRLRKKGLDLPKFARSGGEGIDLKELGKIVKSGGED